MRIKDHQLGVIFLLLQVIGDQAGTLVRPRGAAVITVWNPHQHCATRLHCRQFLLQLQCLWASFIGMRQRLFSGGIKAFDVVVSEIDTRRNNQPIILILTFLSLNESGLSVKSDNFIMRHLNTTGR